MKKENIVGFICAISLLCLTVVACQAEQTKPAEKEKPVISITTDTSYTGELTVYAENDRVFTYSGEIKIRHLPGRKVEITIHTEGEAADGE